jgi:DNA transposition AAA+ family ATPase
VNLNAAPARKELVVTTATAQNVLPFAPAPSLIDAVREEIETSGISQEQAAREIGLSGATISRWLRGTYEGDNDDVARRATSWLESRRQRRAAQKVLGGPDWVRTITAARVLAGLEYAQLAGDLVVVYGIAGAGKTITINRFLSGAVNAWRITANPTMRSPTAILSELAEELHVRGIPERAAKLHRAVTARLRNTKGVIVVDEAQHLTADALETLRSLHDETDVGLCLIGNETVYARLTGGSRAATFAQLYSRIGRQIQIKAVQDKDALDIASAWGIDDNDARNVLMEISRRPGALRDVVKTLRIARALAVEDGGAVTGEHIRAAWNNRTRAS